MVRRRLKQLSLILLVVSLLSLHFGAATKATHAQAALQNPTTQKGLQPQSSATQNTANTQNQVGTLQQNTGESVLSNARGTQALGVVSDPTQKRPDVVVQPNSTLLPSTTVQPQKDSSTPVVWVIIGIIALATVVYVIGQRTLTHAGSAQFETTFETHETVAEHWQKPKKKKRSKKKRTPHQR